MPGAGDAILYEWYVGLENVIKMLNPDSGIRCVIFQHDEYDTVDDVVVEYTDGNVQLCYQVKHNIEAAETKSLTFGSMLEVSTRQKNPENRKCLFEALFQGWIKACETSGQIIKPILFSNRIIHNHRAGRHYDGKPYSAYPIDQFVSKMQDVIAETETDRGLIFEDKTLEYQWKELCSTLSKVDPVELIDFMKVFQVKGNERSLDEMKRSLIAALCDAFSCEEGIAFDLFSKLLLGLTEWTTTGRSSREVTVEDVYSTLSIGEDIDESQHRLAHPYPFFASRRSFCEVLVQQIKETPRKIIFLSGDPGSGKTSTISFLHSEYNLFLLRYHTFRPISPEQHFYNSDPGMCTAENLWGTLLIQLRKRLRGRLAEHNVPVSNKLLSVEELRRHVMRLLGILGQAAVAAGKKEYICIDGIDHAARAKIPVTFLTSLPLPTEIPDGVCFILAGQPATMYQDQYPHWLSTGTAIERITMPKLEIPDIRQLILDRAPQLSDTSDDLAKRIFQKTEGNNLSTVFAVEEIRLLNSAEAVMERLQQSGISGDVQQYYNYIWAHMKSELSGIMGSIIFPESIVACPILLMNGRVNTRILGAALGYGMGKAEWDMILDRLAPLVIRINNEGEYALFHNDFRVFLMGIIHSYQARYEEIALSLAKYLLQNNEGLLSYVMGIPLLQCAGKEELIPQYFTAEFVINALAEGISKVRLDEFAHLSYDAACKNRNYVGFRNTYLAVKTLYQHKQYYEYYVKEYISRDYPEIAAIDISEVRSLPIEHENLDEFQRVLGLCAQLYSSEKEEHKKRALRLYDKWLNGCSPISFVPLCTDTVSEEEPWELKSTDTGFFLQHWGAVAARLNIPAPNIKSDLTDLEWYAVFIFGEQYFTRCIEHKKYELAIGAIKAGYVNQHTFSEKLEEIYYAGAACEFSDILPHIEQSKENPSWNLLALAMKVTCDQSFCPERSILEASPVAKRIYDRDSFTLVLKAFLLGCIEKEIDDDTLISHSADFCQGLEAREKEKTQALFMVKVATLLGKYYWSENPQSPRFEGCAEWLLSASLDRSMDYSKARRFLLYTLLNSKASQTLCKEESFIAALRVSLFDIDLLGMFYKTWILDYLAAHNHHDIIKEYINALYGENCSKISLEDNKGDMHERFRPYGELVEPDLMQQFTAQLKWDVVGYLDYKEYALHAPLNCLENITVKDPSRWKDLGRQLYEQSEIADQYSNHASYDIKNCISESASSCGIADYWELRNWSDEFRLKPDQIYHSLFAFIKTAATIADLQAIWILSCGLHSWYTQDERLGAKNIYDACLGRASELNVDFATFVSQATPQWDSIIRHLSNSASGLGEYEVHKPSHSDESAAISALYNSLSVDESLEHLKTAEKIYWALEHYSVVLEKVLASSEASNAKLTKLLSSFCAHLEGKGWTHDKYHQVISPLLTRLGSDAFWAFAESNASQLSDYDYQTSMRNMQLLFKLMCQDNAAEMESLFTAELCTQRLWSTGNNHFNIRNISENVCHPFINVPNSLVEMAFYILLEQADTQNARKLEIAIYAIYLLGLHFPEIMHMASEQWSTYSLSQEKCLLIVIARWASDGVCSEELQHVLLDLYNNCSELSKKYFLHSIILRLKETGVEVGIVSCTAPAIPHEFSEDSIADEDNCFAGFLFMVERYTGKDKVDSIRKCLFDASPLEHYVRDLFTNGCDSHIPVICEYSGELFYSKEKSGEWASIPLAKKKSYLIPPEDPFLLTEMPQMVFDCDWLPDVTDSLDGKRNPNFTISDLHEIVHSHIGEDEIVLAASLWYPWGYREGTVYTESTKIDWPIKMQRPVEFDSCIGCYGLLINEEMMYESRNSTFGTGGISLFNRVCGNFMLYFGNCQLVPSSAWKDYLGCAPKIDDPYTWVDHSGSEVLRFERIASPVREIMREAYIRQPILFRWICRKSWLENFLQRNHLCLISFGTQEPYPYLGE